jgi:hypothetical protein
MPIACPQCQTQNADGARFCRACGTTLAIAAPPPVEASPAGGVTCDDCGHLNAAGTRYCAKCGYSLVGTVIVSRRDSVLGALAPTAVPAPAPEPPRPAGRIAEDSDSFDALSAPTQVMNMGGDTPGPFSRMAAGAAPGAAPSSRTGLWITLGVVALLLLGGGGWWLMKPASKPVDVAAAAPAAPAATPPAEPPAAAPPVAQPAPVAAPAAPVAVAPPPEPAPAAAPALAIPPADIARPPAAAPDPQRAAALKAARERAERDARATAALAQRERELARQRAEQEAARAAQQARAAAPVPVVPAPVAAAPTVREVKDLCAGRNLISRGLCESRECRKPEHAAEALCRKLKEAEERRLFQ